MLKVYGKKKFLVCVNIVFVSILTAVCVLHTVHIVYRGAVCAESDHQLHGSAWYSLCNGSVSCADKVPLLGRVAADTSSGTRCFIPW